MADSPPPHTTAASDSGQEVSEALRSSSSRDTTNVHNSSEDYDTKDAHDMNKAEAKNATHAVLDIPELLDMILSYLQTKDLTRIFAVSKHWQASILGSVILRRNLFLEAAPATEHLDYVQGKDSESIPCILRKPNENSIPILEPHPVLLSGNVRFAKTATKKIPICKISCEPVRAVQPSAFLSQPPVMEVYITYYTSKPHYHSRSRLWCRGGITFGALQEELEAKRELHLQLLATQATGRSVRLEDVKEEEFNIEVVRAIGTSADMVKQAREAR